MNKLLAAAVTLGLFAPVARADVLTLTTSNPPGSPLLMAPNSMSATFIVKVGNTAPPAGTNMQGWFTDLVIAGDAGATGLTFGSPASGNTAHPANYIFTTSFGSGISITNSGTSLLGNDSDNNINGTPVPQAAATLLAVNFSASPTALGTYGIFAQHGRFNTGWSDQTGVTQFYQGMPNDAAMTRIGEVVVGVPEPGTLALTGLAAVVGGWVRRRRRQPVG